MALLKLFESENKSNRNWKKGHAFPTMPPEPKDENISSDKRCRKSNRYAAQKARLPFPHPTLPFTHPKKENLPLHHKAKPTIQSPPPGPTQISTTLNTNSRIQLSHRLRSRNPLEFLHRMAPKLLHQPFLPEPSQQFHNFGSRALAFEVNRVDTASGFAVRSLRDCEVAG